jgi:hypothetical protein
MKKVLKLVFAASVAMVGFSAQAGVPTPEPASDSGFSWIGIGGGLGTTINPFPDPDPVDPFGSLKPVFPGWPVPDPTPVVPDLKPGKP